MESADLSVEESPDLALVIAPEDFAVDAFRDAGGRMGWKLEATPTHESFGAVEVGQTSAVRTFTLKNVGDTESPFLTVRIRGIASSTFPLTTTCPPFLQPSATCTIDVQFRPSVMGTSTANIEAGTFGATFTVARVDGVGPAPK
jgi:hypothetical protein